MSDNSETTWPEQNVLEKWRREHNLEDLPEWFELKKAVSAYRIQVEQENQQARRALLAEHVPQMGHKDHPTLWDACEAAAAHHGEHHEREERYRDLLRRAARLIDIDGSEADDETYDLVEEINEALGGN